MFDPKARRFSILDFLFSNEKDKTFQNSQSSGRSLVSALLWIAELPSLLPYSPMGIYSVGWSRPQSSSLYQGQPKEKNSLHLLWWVLMIVSFCLQQLAASLCQVTVLFSEPHSYREISVFPWSFHSIKTSRTSQEHFGNFFLVMQLP